MTTPDKRTQSLSLDLIDISGGTQTRVATNDDAIASYADEMLRGAQFPPIIVFYDGSVYWLADGFHRYLAVKRNEGSEIAAEVHAGGRTDALRHALGANATNGLYRTNADKRHVAEIALRAWPDLSNAFLAELCKVSGELVRNVRADLTSTGIIQKAEIVTGRDGKEYPAAIERQPRGKSEASASDSESGGGGGFTKGKGDPGATGGSVNELEAEARSMIRKGETNPFELPRLMSATGHDYAATVVALLGTMKADLKDRTDGLLRIKRWVDQELGEAN
ncbi:MAG: ParB N-terminal domain-containing protein [Opitutaceae bacterium]|nr:ParB N-terminal domain-containing protein [Opitutaceae bacterium]